MHGQFVWYELTTPDVDAAKKFYPRFTGWGTQHRPDIDQVHLLAQSRVVQMGAAIANIALSGLINIYSDRESFNAAVLRFGLALRPS